MFERMSPDEERALAERLKGEAQASRPAFSEDLHARICGAVRAGQAGPDRPRDALAGRARWAYVALAAACLVGAAALAWRLTTPAVSPANAPDTAKLPAGPSSPPTDLETLTGIPDRTAEHVGALVESTLANQQWAYLDHDARLAADMLLDQFPLEIASAGQP
jgi:hypothetical protein